MKKWLDDPKNLFALLMTASVIAMLTGVYLAAVGIASRSNGGEEESEGEGVMSSTDATYPFRQQITVTAPEYSDSTSLVIPSSEIKSDFALLVDVTDGKVIASRNYQKLIYPASMTKVMTLIVAIESLPYESSMDEVITVSESVVKAMAKEGASGYGFKAGDKLTVRELLYAVILQSDGVACIELANYIAGSEENFVKLMNEKATEMGLTKTNFTNCTGLHSKSHFSTCEEIAMIMSYAMQNTHCANILAAKSLVLSSNFRADGYTYTLYHATLASKFDELRPSFNKVNVVGAKSGWTGSDSGYCMVSFATDKNNRKYVLVTASAPGKNDAITDMQTVYNSFIK
jgi:D-alanyl-D-alanine carboxypeptidase (penicillin-binding protein 5/6)